MLDFVRQTVQNLGAAIHRYFVDVDKKVDETVSSVGGGGISISGRIFNSGTSNNVHIRSVSTNGKTVTINGKTYTTPVTVDGVTYDEKGNLSF